MRSVLVTLVVLSVTAFAVGCTASTTIEGEVVGVITEVSGDLTTIDSFVVLDEDGVSHKFAPGPGMTVDGAPPPHLRDHVISGEPVKVRYHQGSDGQLVADEVVHA